MTDEEAIEILEEFKTKGYSMLYMKYGDRISTNLKLERAIETVLNLIQKQQHIIEGKEAIIDLMAKYIEEQTGSCPLDMFDYKEIDCENVCKHDMYPCWIEYFKRKVEDK